MWGLAAQVLIAVAEAALIAAAAAASENRPR